jgi:hypothetical protein
MPIIHLYLFSMLLVTGAQSKNVLCFCLDMAQCRSLIGQSLCNAVYWSNIGFSASIGAVVEMGVLISTIETTAYRLPGLMCVDIA